ncbi:TonB-dependent siderophore receptor [Chlorogloeopsis sp. ULAP01]|uniref:TonB-dependent siderophore receptor n=1 Tax=Chlorogloeopsis sp. ULAP01 TaxID=3056483 RepID=UPI0025AA8046|nr:TonB-dependent siderophore receptor [Chlorogloeopsis sp. ULAP01]MDM9380814.1 TonB-dependent siderophore receptor [Chlorogloeopsis sp. ULAP01]
MKSWRFADKNKCFVISLDIYLWLVVSVVGVIGGIFAQPVQALASEKKQDTAIAKIQTLSEINFPATSVKDLFSQSPTNPPSQGGVVIITGVKANPTDKGVEVILQTNQGEQLQITNRSAENNFIADIPNAQLRLPNGDAFTFRSQNPVEGITEITVTNLDANTIRVTVAGVAAMPTVELFDSNEGLIFALTPAATAMQPPQQPEGEQPTSETPPEEPTAQDDEPIELVVTGEQDGYRVRDSSTATKTDTPLRDIPQSIQVVPRQVIEDQQAARLRDVIKNVPGIASGFVSPRAFSDTFSIRGFDSIFNLLTDGLLDVTNQSIGFNAATIDRVEVLKGPASVLFGQGSLGGIINYVTKQPLREPYYSIEGSAGSYNFYRGAIDLSGPLNPQGTVAYRFNAAAQTTESFIDFYEQQRYVVSPVLSWQLSERTKLTLQAEYQQVTGPFDIGLPAVGTVLPNPNGKIPRNRFIGEPNIDDSNNRVFRIGYNFEHRFSDNWQLNSAFRTSLLYLDRELVFSTSLAPDGRTLNRGFGTQYYTDSIYNLDTYAVGKFSTGSIQHQLVTGFNLSRQDTFATNPGQAIAPLDLFNPVYGATPTESTSPFNYRNRADSLGLYVQDQITLGENFKVLLGGRFDIANQTFENLVTSSTSFGQTEVFSPRVGIVYQPIPAISLYASYGQSFNYTTSVASAAAPLPQRGTQYEVGIKGELSNRLAATLAFYDLTRTNVPTADPNNPLRSIQTGEQNSKGIEFNVSGEILPGWNVIAGYALTDAKITKDNTFPVGNQINNVPNHSFNLWTTYEIQSGNLQGLGFGLGFFYVGARQGDLLNTFELPSYLRTDAALYYKRGQFRAGINFRNLFNVDYFESAQNRNRVFYGDPFTVQGTISWQF